MILENLKEGVLYFESLGLLYALILLVLLDYITGVCLAAKNKAMSSQIGGAGIIRKVMIFVLVALSRVIDVYFLPVDGSLELVTIFFYCVNESISIVENAAKLGVPLPAKLVLFLKNVDVEHYEDDTEQES
ncbi:phage holin family protein [Bengtsoniella intestinalis]|uniref:phage holin family protein n=1 Tax=Bengtsoniella intestinalis TaxID=3073143 RepID=UPI00391F5B3C